MKSKNVQYIIIPFSPPPKHTIWLIVEINNALDKKVSVCLYILYG